MKRSRARTRLSLVVPLLLPVLLLGSGPPSKAAGVLPLGSCWDFRYFDNLVSSPAGAYCASALTNAGYWASGFHNASAKFALARLAGDGVFFFAGHALVSGNPGAALSLLYEFPGPGGSMDALVGPPTGLALQGPLRICNETGTACRNVTLTSYPWVHLLAKHNLVVLESCNTAGSNLFAPASMTTLAKAAGVGTSIGFRNAVSFPLGGGTAYGIRWAQVFWANLDAGAEYTAATIAATNAVGGCCGYSSWVLLKNPGAPTRLRQAKYYPAGGLRVGAAASAATATADARVGALSGFLRKPVGSSSWTQVSRLGGARYQTSIEGLGLFEVDARSLEVEEAVFENELSGEGPSISIDGSRIEAERFARDHFNGFGGLASREATFLDHGDFQEHRFVWQMRSGQAWLPTKVTVGVNAVTGRVAYYSADRSAVSLPTTATISAEWARAAALASSGVPENQADTSTPVLEVAVSTTGEQRLVWITGVDARSEGAVRLPTHLVIWTDALTGATEVMARS